MFSGGETPEDIESVGGRGLGRPIGIEVPLGSASGKSRGTPFRLRRPGPLTQRQKRYSTVLCCILLAKAGV